MQLPGCRLAEQYASWQPPAAPVAGRCRRRRAHRSTTTARRASLSATGKLGAARRTVVAAPRRGGRTPTARLNAVFFYGLNVLLGIELPVRGGSASSRTSISTRPAATGRRHGPRERAALAAGPRRCRSRVLLSLTQADLTPAFHWNLKQLRVCAGRISNPEERAEPGPLVDRIVETEEQAVLDERHPTSSTRSSTRRHELRSCGRSPGFAPFRGYSQPADGACSSWTRASARKTSCLASSSELVQPDKQASRPMATTPSIALYCK